MYFIKVTNNIIFYRTVIEYIIKTRAIDARAAEPTYLKIARYKPKTINRGNENPMAAMRTIHCWP